MGKSDLLKDSMKSGLDGLLSSTKKSPQRRKPHHLKLKRACGTLQFRYRQECSYAYEIPCY